MRLPFSLAAALLISCLTQARAQPPVEPPLTAAQKERLKERDRLQEEAIKLAGEKKFAETIATFEKIISLEKAVLGPRHSQVVETLEKLAGVHEARQDFAGARKVLTEIAAIQVQRFGRGDWRTGDAQRELNDLAKREAMTAEQRREHGRREELNQQALQLYAQGKYKEALESALLVRDLDKKLWGENHLRYATSLGNLAQLYQAQGAYAPAEKFYLQARDLCKKVLGEQHPDYATSLNNLAYLYQAQGVYPQAEKLHLQARDLRKKLLGENHPAYATSLNNLAHLNQAPCNYLKA